MAHPLAEQLNQSLSETAPEVFSMLAPLGRRLYFPKGILFQSTQAKERGTRFNATIGIATGSGGPLYLPSIHRHLHDVAPADAYPYAPPAGRKSLREAWCEKLLAENPSLRDKVFGEPIVTAAISHGLSVVADLFVDAGDVLLVPDQLWGNYRLAFETRYGATLETFPFFAGTGLNVAGFETSLKALADTRDKLLVILNFPNNPTGYMPTEDEAGALVAALKAQAKAGTRLVVLCDDAYFGLFYHLDGPSLTESLFARLAGLHPNLLAIKLDGATKELFVWGLRCGFVTFGPGRPETAPATLKVLEQKARGAIRAVTSNSPHLSQSLVEKALRSPTIGREREEKRELLAARAREVHRVANLPEYSESWDVYPFNSGYFMLIKVKGVDAHQLREHLLEAYQTGLIATSPTDVRVAFSCLELEEIAPLFAVVHEAITELRNQGRPQV